MHNESAAIRRRASTAWIKLDDARCNIIAADDGSTDDIFSQRIYAYKRKHHPDDILHVVP